MKRRQIKTDNSYLMLKVYFRMRFLREGGAYRVLDLFAGQGLIWKTIKRLRPDLQLTIFSIDRKSNKNVDITGENLKVLGALDLTQYDVIDLDAYGVPFKQLEKVFSKEVKGVVFVTFIQSMFGRLPKGMLKLIGYMEAMLDKCPSLFNRNGFAKFKQYLAMRKVEKISYISMGNKHYIHFRVDNYIRKG